MREMGRESGRVCTAAKARGAAHMEGEKGGKRDEREKHRRERRDRQRAKEENSKSRAKRARGRKRRTEGKEGPRRRRQENAEEGQGNQGKRGGETVKGDLQGKGRRTSPRDEESAKGRCIQGRGSALRGESATNEEGKRKGRGMKSAKGTGAAHRKGKGREAKEQ